MALGPELAACTGDRDQDHPQEKEMQKSKMAVEEALQIAVKKREAKSKGEKEGIMPPLILKSFVKMYAMAQLASTPRMEPKKAVTPLRVMPATRKMMTALSSVTAANVMTSTFPPFRW